MALAAFELAEDACQVAASDAVSRLNVIIIIKLPN
jgi:hypothetical protein